MLHPNKLGRKLFLQYCMCTSKAAVRVTYAKRWKGRKRPDTDMELLKQTLAIPKHYEPLKTINDTKGLASVVLPVRKEQEYILTTSDLVQT